MFKSTLTALCFVFAGSLTSHAQVSYIEPDQRLAEGDWLLECYGAESRDGNCQLYHRVLMNDATEIALVFTVAYQPNGSGPFLQMALPLGSNIAAGARVIFGDAFNQSIPFSRCTEQGCLVEGEITAGLLQAMRVTPIGYVGVTTDVGPMNIPLSMRGFSKAIDRIRPVSTAPSDPTVPDLAAPLNEPPIIDPVFAPVTGE